MQFPNKLVLGWRVGENDLYRDPAYFRSASQRTPPSESDLVAIPPEAMDAHSAIFAQSGSGKSTFLGRLVEEILLKTR
jgi:hypothetical protein